MGVRSALVAVEDPRYSKEWSASLRLRWRLDGSATRLFLEVGSSPDLRLFPLLQVFLLAWGVRGWIATTVDELAE